MTDLKNISVDDLIVVLDLGTSRIRAAVGVRSEEGGMAGIELLCFNSVESEGVKRGRVYNLDTSAFAIKNLLIGLENQLNKVVNEERAEEERIKLKIKKVCVGLNGRSIKTIENKVLRNLGSEQTEITRDLMQSLYEEAQGIKMTDSEIFKTIQQEFLIDDEEELSPIGCLANRVSGRYKIVVGDTSLRRCLEMCINRAGYELADTPLAIEATALSVLSYEEKSSGCAVIDFGAGTTTIAVYNKGILRDLIVAPYGGNVITKDIASLKIQEDKAEKLKVKFGSTIPGSTENVDINVGTFAVNSCFLAEVIECRLEEIITSIWSVLEKNYSLHYINEVVLTGNGAFLKNLKEKITLLTGLDVRIGTPMYSKIYIDGAEDSFKNKMDVAQVLGLMEIANGTYVVNVAEEPIEKPTVKAQPTKKAASVKKTTKGIFSQIGQMFASAADSVLADDETN